MKNVFSDKTELQRLAVQRKLLWEYEYPIYQQIIKDRENLTLLDVGCNNGNKTIERFGRKNFAKVVGVDCLEDMVAEAEELFGDDVFSFFYCDVTKERFADKIKAIMQKENIVSFDVINCSFLLMHLQEPGAVLEGLRQLLSPDGVLVVIEPDDTRSKMEPDKDNIFSQFLAILANDPYAGKRDFGSKVLGILQESGYENIELKLSEIAAHKGEVEKKENIFVTFCSYLPEDLIILREENAENAAYQEWWNWVQDNFAALRRLMTEEKTEISIGIKIYTCTCGGGQDAD